MLCVVNVQVQLPGLQSRSLHSAAAFRLSPGMTEVTIFGGCPEWPSNYRSFCDLSPVANTTVLRFGEYTSCVCIVSYSHVVVTLWVLCMEVVLTLGLLYWSIVNSMCPQRGTYILILNRVVI